MNIEMIVAMADNYAIGFKGRIPWHIKADLQHFKKITEGHAVIMGRKTFESIGKVLPNRFNIIISSTITNQDDRLNRFALVAPNLDLALKVCELHYKTVMVIGGASLYNEAMDKAKKLYVTRVHIIPENADTFFPAFEHLDFKRESIEKHDNRKLKYDFETWVR